MKSRISDAKPSDLKIAEAHDRGSSRFRVPVAQIQSFRSDSLMFMGPTSYPFDS